MTRLRFTMLSLAAFGALALASRGQAFQRVAAMLLQLYGAPVAASSAVISEHELGEINAMPPQDQVERLLERAINHYQGAAEEIAKRVDGWTGKINATPKLNTMTSTAYFASDLRVRAIALEIWLAEYNFHKTSEAVDDLIRGLAAPSDRRYFLLSNLAILGNRGIEPEKVFNTILLYVNDPDPSSRSAAINALGLLGTENTIQPLLEIFRNDSSYDLRERAACNLADSGMLSRELRKRALPELIRLSQDPDLDPRMKKWVAQAIGEIGHSAQ